MNPSGVLSVTLSFQNQVFLLRNMIKPTLGKNPSGVLSVTSSFQNQVLLLKKHDKTHTRHEPFRCSQCDFEFSKPSALIEVACLKSSFKFKFSCSYFVTRMLLTLRKVKNLSKLVSFRRYFPRYEQKKF